MTPSILVIAKQPVPGRVKTRLCPPCTPQQAAAVADVALRDTLDVAARSGAGGLILVISGVYDPPAGWSVIPQRGDGLGERLTNAFYDGLDGGGERRPGLLIGMDTPQVRPDVLGALLRRVCEIDAVLCPALDGGWWALGLRDPRGADVLCDVAMSTPETGWRTLEALRKRGLRVEIGPVLRDVDTATDAHCVARAHPGGRFAAAVAAHVPLSEPVGRSAGAGKSSAVRL